MRLIKKTIKVKVISRESLNKLIKAGYIVIITGKVTEKD